MASNSGRNINITNGGTLVFHESNATGNHKATIVTSDLTADRTIIIGDFDGVMQGLEPGKGWPTTKGGTGLTVVPLNNLLAGTGDEQMKLIAAPETHNTTLTWDGMVQEFRWVPFDYSGLEVTTATNILNDPTLPGVYSHKTGSQLAFKNLEAMPGIKLTPLPSKIQIGLDNDTLAIPGNTITGTVPPSAGGTGISTILPGQIIIGGPNNTFIVVPAPAPNQYLYTDANGTTTWKTITFADTIPGQIAFPELKTYHLEINSAFAFEIESVTHFTELTSSNDPKLIFTLSNSTTSSTMISSTTNPVTTPVSMNVPVGGKLRLIVTELANIRDFMFSIKIRRV